MTPAAWGALGIAVFGAISYAAGSILQAVGARRSTGTVRTLGHPLYLLGVGCDILSWAGSMVALRELAVYQVQSVLAGSLAITVVMARVFLGSRVRRRDAFAVVITVGALAVLAMSAGPQEHVAASSSLRIGFCAAAGATVILGWLAAKFSTPGVVAGLSGLAFGGAALAGRALSLPENPTSHLSATLLAIFTEPLTAALVVFAAAGMLMYTHALQHGQVGPVTAVLWIGEVVAPSAVGLALLGDTVLPGWEVRAAVAGFIVVASAVVLATAPATSDTAQPAQEASPAPAPVPARAGAPALVGPGSATVNPQRAAAVYARRSAPAYAQAAGPGIPRTAVAAYVPQAGGRSATDRYGRPAVGANPAPPAYPVWPPPTWHEPTPPPGRLVSGMTVWWGPPNDRRPIFIPPDRPRTAAPVSPPIPVPRRAPGWEHRTGAPIPAHGQVPYGHYPTPAPAWTHQTSGVPMSPQPGWAHQTSGVPISPQPISPQPVYQPVYQPAPAPAHQSSTAHQPTYAPNATWAPQASPEPAPAWINYGGVPTLAHPTGWTGTQRPGTQQPGTQQPGTQRPSTQRPSTQRPSTQQPSNTEPILAVPVHNAEPVQAEHATHWPHNRRAFLPQPTREQPGWA
jgi:hypothetical protein